MKKRAVLTITLLIEESEENDNALEDLKDYVHSGQLAESFSQAEGVSAEADIFIEELNG